MHKIIRFSLYLVVILIYNFTTLYTSSVHNHNFTWTDEESCSAYIISISQNSDTFPFLIYHDIRVPNISYLNINKFETTLDLESFCNKSKRAPPPVI